MKVYARANLETGLVEFRVYETGAVLESMSPMDAYARADQITDAADKLLSQDARQLPASPKTQ